jgi:hypothetical protein
MSLRLVPPLPAGTPGDPGLTGPGSVTWRISRLAPVRLRFWAHYHVAVARCRPPAGPNVAVPSGQLGSGER